MVFLCFTLSDDELKCRRLELDAKFNYESQHACATEEACDARLQSLQRDGYSINRVRVKIGHSQQPDAYERAKKCLRNWRHFQLGWAFVPDSTRIQVGQTFPVCSRELVAWIINPLQIRYTQNVEQPTKSVFAFGSGTLQGHLLAGEERFAVEWNKVDGSLWYEILSFSKPAHPLAYVAYPYVKFKQRLFAKHSSHKMIHEMQYSESKGV